MIYRALSVVKPYGHYISTGRKTIEVRNWQPVDGMPLENLVIVENAVRLNSSTHPTDPDGRIVAIVKVTGIRNWEKKDLAASCAGTFQDGLLAWDLGNIRKATYPMKVAAKLRIYDLDLDSGLLKVEPIAIPKSNYAQQAANSIIARKNDSSFYLF
ncbi:MAG: ASCH domain-containing protein [Dehalococcoidales bacterium]|nr:ASCH domain-containing protein [Dehalococcoidales bacterium]